MVSGNPSKPEKNFEDTNSIGFTGDARVWLDRQEVFTDLFAWNVGTETITDYCDVQMISSVIDGSYLTTMWSVPEVVIGTTSYSDDAAEAWWQTQINVEVNTSGACPTFYDHLADFGWTSEQ